ncbi:MAG: ferredoxin--NADP reductase [Aestuariivita sp.]|nr:ferredoxin--NADP reductase [Aestuariivita sp.]
MTQFHKLKIIEAKKTTREAVVLTLEPQSGEFNFTQGQYLTFRHFFNGKELRRSYSICVEQGSPVLKVAIKRVQGGAFSSYANDVLREGDFLEAMKPMGKFYTKINPHHAKHYIAFACGSGITPVLSILKTILLQEPLSSFTLVYANREMQSIMFREELNDLKNYFMRRLSLIHILKQNSQEIDLFAGRLTYEKCKDLFQHWINIKRFNKAFICGPESMMLDIVAALQDQGFDDDAIKFELFGTTRKEWQRLDERTTKWDISEKIIDLMIFFDGASQRFDINKSQSILDAALENAIDVPYACKSGICSTCKCKVLEGEVEMLANHALSEKEVKDGYVLSCQSYPTSSRIVIDYDQ